MKREEDIRRKDRYVRAIIIGALLLALINIIILSLVVSMPSKVERDIRLMTVSYDKNKSVGGMAFMYLTVSEGNGDVFIDSYPLTKLDTQISTRAAKRVACSLLEKDCSNLDFFYKIRANSSVVGGPSAGAAAALLTVIALDNLKPNSTIAMTGTINSGGIIGDVGSVPEKIEAAALTNTSLIFVPLTTTYCINKTNTTEDCKDQDEELIKKLQDKDLTRFRYKNSEIIKVLTLEEVLFYATGKNYTKEFKPAEASQTYLVLMNEVAQDLCNRRKELVEEVKRFNISENIIEEINNKTDKIKEAEETKKYYSMASFCFSDNIILRKEVFSKKNQEELLRLLKELNATIEHEQAILDKKEINTISELETYNIVSDRISEARDIIDVINITNISYVDLAYAYERAYSVSAWKRFFSLQSKPYKMDQTQLSRVCEEKISEAEEIIEYVGVYSPLLYQAAYNLIEKAKMEREKNMFIKCFFEASKAKAEAESFSLLLSSSDVNNKALVDKVLNIAERVMAEQSAKGMFPILGYSYYVYAGSLKDNNPAAALTYGEYAIELSKLDLYFPEEKGVIQKSFLFIYSKAILTEFLVLCNLLFIIIVAFFLLRRRL